jgi:uncharacterized membrane protein
MFYKKAYYNRLFDKENNGRVRVTIAIINGLESMECGINITVESLTIEQLFTVLPEVVILHIYPTIFILSVWTGFTCLFQLTFLLSTHTSAPFFIRNGYG